MISTFKGFTESGREFLAEVVTLYHPEFIPLLGSFILVTVMDHQALLVRITQFYPMGTRLEPRLMNTFPIFSG